MKLRISVVIVLALSLAVLAVVGERFAKSRAAPSLREVDALEREELARLLPTWTYPDIERLSQRILLDNPDPLEIGNANRVGVLYEHLHRIEAHPDSLISFSAFTDGSLAPSYRGHLFAAFAHHAKAVTDSTLARLLRTMVRFVTDQNEDDKLRELVVDSGDKIVREAEKRALIDHGRHAHLADMFMAMIADSTEAREVRLNAFGVVRRLRLYDRAPRLLELFVDGRIGIPLLEVRILRTLGEWRYEALLPVLESLLDTTDDDDLRRAATYAIGYYEVFDILRPLVECRERRADRNHECYRALERSLPVICAALTSGDQDRVVLGLRACEHVGARSEEVESALILLRDGDEPNISETARRLLAKHKGIR